jgi:hypothetical protein
MSGDSSSSIAESRTNLGSMPFRFDARLQDLAHQLPDGLLESFIAYLPGHIKQTMEIDAQVAERQSRMPQPARTAQRAAKAASPAPTPTDPESSEESAT